MFNAAIKARMDALEAQKSELDDALAGAELSKALELTEKQILYFLMQFRNMDLTKIESQKRVIATFVNSVFVYDDGRITITFNYSSDTNTVTLHELPNTDTAGVSGFGCCAEWPTTRQSGRTPDIHVAVLDDGIFGIFTGLQNPSRH